MNYSTTNDSTRNSQLQATIFAQRKKTEEDLCFQKNLNERVLNSVSDAILLIDMQNLRDVGKGFVSDERTN